MTCEDTDAIALDSVIETEWQMIQNKRSFKVKSYFSNMYCSTMRLLRISHKFYTKGTKGVKLVNQLIWLNYSMYPYLPPKFALCMSLVLLCIFMTSS